MMNNDHPDSKSKDKHSMHLNTPMLTINSNDEYEDENEDESMMFVHEEEN